MAKPILFNTEMVRAILLGRKTQTRRIVKQNTETILNSPYHKEHSQVPDAQLILKLCQPLYETGNILYVRETWSKSNAGTYLYRAFPFDAPEEEDVAMKSLGYKWHPSIHMPKKAARIFLRITAVRTERLQEITIEDIENEGIICPTKRDGEIIDYIADFARLWDDTIGVKGFDKYGWNADPWVWVYEFERIEIND
ncbi:MAG: hypothetical protein J6C82_05030 [Clostridia bacterium]|nr:hypothetical protein [Clostridia bacterium]